MIYILLIAIFLIINFTNGITKIQNKVIKSKFEIFIIENYKLIFGLVFLLFSIFFWQNSCFLLDIDC
ncbi:MAG: hypothetical protein CL496_01900 [Actinobacteria bacterium]|jgi:hypothetical protein|nr:hypothetical protein [Actinomycetota bacterium]